MSFKPKIAVIRQLALGDVILTTPIVKQIFADYSGQCDIDVVTLKPEVFKHNPIVANILMANEPINFVGTYDKIINLDLAYEKYPKIHIGIFTHSHAPQYESLAYQNGPRLRTPSAFLARCLLGVCSLFILK